MAQLLPVYHWQDRAEWLVLVALKNSQLSQGGWTRATAAWERWHQLRQINYCGSRGSSKTTYVRILEKLRILGWVESRPNPQSAGKTIRGQERVEWRLKAGLKIGLWESHTDEAITRWICT